MICVSSIEINLHSIDIVEDTWYYDLNANVYPSNATCKDVCWYSNDTNVVSVDSSTGHIYGKSLGTARIYAVATDGSGVNNFCTVTVNDKIYVNSICLNRISLTLEKDTGYGLQVSIQPWNATNRDVSWNSSNSEVASVRDGVVYAKSKGDTIITATAIDGSEKTALCYVTVTDDNPNTLIDGGKKISQNTMMTDDDHMSIVNCITVSPESLITYVGTYEKLSAYVFLMYGCDYRVYWYSEDSSIVNVNYNTGEICAKAVGTVKVWTVSAADVSKSDCCTIEVKPEFIQMEKLTILQSDIIMFAGESIQLTANICPENATNRILNWSSTDINVVKVDSEGFITALCPGEVLILVRATDGSRMQNYCRVTVLPIKE